MKILMLFLVILITYKSVNSKKKSSTIMTYSLRIFSFYGLLLTTITTIPFYNIFISIIYCNKESPISSGFECYTGLYYIHLSAAIIGCIILFVFSLVFTMLYIDLNPNSKIPFAAPQSRINLFRLLIKILLPLNFTVFFKGDLNQ